MPLHRRCLSYQYGDHCPVIEVGMAMDMVFLYGCSLIIIVTHWYEASIRNAAAVHSQCRLQREMEREQDRNREGPKLPSNFYNSFGGSLERGQLFYQFSICYGGALVRG